MATNVSISYTATRQAPALTESEQTRLRALAAKNRLSPAEAYTFGGLKARARSSPGGRRLLDDVTHDQAGRSQPVSARRANSMVAKAVADAVAARLAEGDDD
jgi:hypothetical protein